MNEDSSKETKAYLGITKLRLDIVVTAAQSLWKVASSFFSSLKIVKKEFREKTNRKLQLKLNISLRNRTRNPELSFVSPLHRVYTEHL